MTKALFVSALLGLAACAAPAPWQPLFDGRTLDGIAPTAFGGEGEVRVEGGRIVLEAGSPLTGFTVRADLPERYELEVEAARLEGTDFFCGLTFPVRDRNLTLVLGGWGGAVCGLSCLDGLDASDNETRFLRRFERGRFYRILVQVTPKRVRASLDGEPVVAVAITGRELSLRPEVEPSAPLGFACFSTRTAVARLRWRALR